MISIAMELNISWAMTYGSSNYWQWYKSAYIEIIH